MPLVHVEAGMRSYRSDMPEERNRIETDQLADLHCAPTEAAAERLRAEGVAGTVITTGDVLFDMLLETRDRLPPQSRGGRVRAGHRPPQLQHRRRRAAGAP